MVSKTEPRIYCGGVIEGPLCDGQICIYSGINPPEPTKDKLKHQHKVESGEYWPTVDLPF